jgi:arylsulfatase A
MNQRATRRSFLKVTSLGITASIASSAFAAEQTAKNPNNVVIFLDDSGFADFSPFGNPSYPTPNVQKLAAEGCRFTNFHVPQAICSASRGALLTGCYPERTKLFSAHGPRARGMDPKWPTIAQILKPQGYKSAIFGKWHIGDQPETRPPARGFDESCGLMYSNDMWRFHPGTRHFDGWPLQFWENGKITIEDVAPEHQKNLTKWYTEHAVDFIKRHKESPFFLYVPHSMPHVPLFVSKEFEGKSGEGLYADVMMEIDWSVGQIMKTLKDSGLQENTLVVFTSDNGPWVSYGDHAGKTPYREAKATSFDGGTRSACIMRMPGMIKAGSSCDQLFCSIDLMPTFAALAGAKTPQSPFDGQNVIDIITAKKDVKNPHQYYAFTTGGHFDGIFSGDGHWKLHVPHGYRTLKTPGKDGLPGKYKKMKIDFALFDMGKDPFETTNVIEKYPEVAGKLKRIAEEHRRSFFASNAAKP